MIISMIAATLPRSDTSGVRSAVARVITRL